MALLSIALAPHGRPPRWAAGAAYLAVFILLDWVSYIRPLQGLNITPWNPQPALAVAVLLQHPRGLLLVWAGLLGAELAVRGLPADWLVTLGATAALAMTYGAIAAVLRARLDRGLALAHRRDLGWLGAAVLLGSLASAVIYVATYALAGLGPRGAIAPAIARYLVGDAVGMLVLLPMLLMLMDPMRRAALAQVVRGRQGWAIALVIVAMLWAVFARPGEAARFFYLLLLPVVWAATRLGLAGAVLAAALTQVGLVVAVQSAANADLTVFELQVLLAVITMTGLLLGVVVDERERTAGALRGSLHMAAAGQMAAALAHELSQPLTALSSYARASQVLLRQDGGAATPARAQLEDVAGRIVDDAQRAGEVVKRLRDFFRSGTTRLQPVSLQGMVDEALLAQQSRAQALGLTLSTGAAPVLPAVWLDRVQIAVVLRNLIANALDAAAPAGAARVELRLRAEGGMVRVDVLDSGPGVPPARLAALFEPGASDKPGGMGVGLSISRAIVEAHGGRLWAEPGPGGRFCFTLPIAPEGGAAHQEDHDAS